MGRKTRKKHVDDTHTSSSSPSTSDDSESSLERRHRHRKVRRRKDESSRREKERKREKRKRKEKERERKRRKSRREDRREKRRDYGSDSKSGSGSSSGSDSEEDKRRVEPEVVVQQILMEFPNVGNDLKQFVGGMDLLQMIDDGQAVDIKGISERSLNKHLKKLFLSLKLKENGDRVFLLSSKSRPTLDVVGHLIQAHTEPKEQQLTNSGSVKDAHLIPEHAESSQVMDENNSDRDDSATPKRRVIGPAMPSAELLAAAAKLTEAQAELREAEIEEDGELFIGPPPPALVAEAESANEAERFEEVTRIMGVESDCPYDVIGANRNTTADNIKKKYWKLSLMVHPDKCPHPQAHQAFIILNKAFKELQDPDKLIEVFFSIEMLTRDRTPDFTLSYHRVNIITDLIKLNEPVSSKQLRGQKSLLAVNLFPESSTIYNEEMKTGIRRGSGGGRKALDEKIKLKEEQEEFKAELRAMREAAQWRRLQVHGVLKNVDLESRELLIIAGISMEGDDELLAEVEVKAPPKRDEWMTTLPPERKVRHFGLQCSIFAYSLEAYNEAAALASNEEEKTKRSSSDADLVDKYNKEKRSKSLVQKHQEEASKRPKKKSKQQSEKEKDEWEGKHPWKPWDREKDLTAGRQSVNLDTENMVKGLTSRFSTGSFQRNFL
ncbi:calponin-like proteiny domain-containing protein [Gossypium australe]|uniref:Calponin-like proteiny domain-containing protein n=1 Tax=Gossypium australe TaxID=47621 RepID=A0A5B6WYJ6_9ROSI|nr:calponin-like proteiny domain-containing protein [Gossypium australe]